MKRTAVILTIAWAAAASLWAADEPWLAYSAAKVREAPVIDGRLTDACWQGLEQTRPLTRIGGAAAPVVTQGMASWDAQNIYIAFICAEPMIVDVQQKIEQEQIMPWTESVELFVDADHDHFTYVQFRVDILGNRDTHAGNDSDRSMDARWSGAVAKDHDRWTVEMAIPWNLVAKSQPDEKTVWGLNLNRNRTIGSEGGWTCWSDTKGGFHSPSRFGHLVFFPYPVHLKHYFAGVFDEYMDDINRIVRRQRLNDVRNGPQIQSLAIECGQFLKSLETNPIVNAGQAVKPYEQGATVAHKLETLRDEVYLRAIRDMKSRSRQKTPINRNGWLDKR